MKLLNSIQKKLKVPKNQYNKFSEFYYRNCEDILEAIKPLLGDGVLILTDEIVQVGDRYYVKATATLMEEKEDVGSAVSAVGWARETLERPKFDGAQLTGSASSYARKYALNGLFCIDDTKDADNEAPETAAVKQEKPKYDYPAMTEKNDASGLGADPKKIAAAMDRIKRNLKALGHDVEQESKEERVKAVSAAIAFELDMDISEAKDLASLEAIGQALAEKADKKK